MLGCETVVCVAQAFPQASDREVVEKADVFQRLYARYRADVRRPARRVNDSPCVGGMQENCALRLLKIMR
jgi:hypothetical protein